MYLQNNGKPYSITIDKQKCIDWYESDGKRKVVEIIWPRRESLEGPEAKEKRMVKELGIAPSQKALLYYASDARIEPGKPEEVASGRPLGKPKIMYEDKTFIVTHYPHVINYFAGGKFEEGSSYNIPVAGSDWAKKLGADFVKVENDTHAELIMKTFHFIDEVNEDGKIIKSNPWREKEDNKPVEGNMPKDLLEFDVDQAPRKSAIAKRAKLTKDENMETT